MPPNRQLSKLGGAMTAVWTLAQTVAMSQIQPELVYHIAFLSIATVNWFAYPLGHRRFGLSKE
jgi:hypothetical protein